MRRFSIIQKKEKWTLTWQGRLIVLLIFVLLLLIYTKCIVSFLSPHKPVDADVLVVEGYMPDYAMEAAIKIFKEGNYSHLLLTGKPRLKGSHLDRFKNDGEYSAATMVALGFDRSLITVVSMNVEIKKDRTYSSARAINSWILENLPEVDSFDLISLGCHSRRSHLLFRMASDEKFNVGVYCVPDQSFDPKKWWNNSHGFREINKETIAWIYARFFFFPAK